MIANDNETPDFGMISADMETLHIAPGGRLTHDPQLIADGHYVQHVCDAVAEGATETEAVCSGVAGSIVYEG